MSKNLVGAYVRVSRNSEYSESDTLENQLTLIKNYCDRNELVITEKYIDNGYSGMNFDRPGFNKMLEDIKNNKINCIIVKDISRFGRNLGWVDVYLSEYLPELGVRFISIIDSIDSNDNSEYADELSIKYMEMIYEQYAVDGSKKVKQIKHIQQLKGEYIGVSAPYGYLKNPNDSHKLIIDKYASKIIKQIFEMTLELKSKNEIVEILNNEDIYPPSKYKAEVIKVTSDATRISSKWTTDMIRQILSNEVYIGNMVQGKLSKPRRKSTKRIKNKKEDWIIVKNTHKPIISKEDYDRVQKILDFSPSMIDDDNLLLKYLICPNCGSYFYKKKTKYNIYYYCKKFRNKKCTSHSVVKKILEELVLEQLKEKDINITKLTDEVLNKYIKCIYVYDKGKVEIKFSDN